MAARPVPAGTSNSRRLVAVWFADIVGYSSLSSRDESAALQQIHNFQAACQDAVSAYGGRVVKYLGDGAFAEFPSTEAAVRSAQSLCELFSAEGALLRVGVHVGDVVARTDGDLFGDGVNTASRLQVEARPGQILVSGDVWRQLRSVRGLEFQRIGLRELRGIEHAIELFAVKGEPVEREGGGGVVGFIRELRRRYVFRAGLVYLIAAWLVIQVAVAVWDPLGLPGWTATLVIVLAGLGFPIALVLAWAFEISPDGIVRTGRRAVHSQAATFNGDVRSDDGTTSNTSVALVAKPPELPAVKGFPDVPAGFVGREKEIAKLSELVKDPKSRLVTLVGPGGIGKTSLAIKAARENADSFRSGIVFVPLASQTSPSSVLPAVAEQLGIPLSPGADARAQVKDFLRQKQALIILDNFEQLAQHAGFLAEVINEAPDLWLLVTSRHRLNLKVETVVPVEGLSVRVAGPDGRGSDAERLFIDSARRSDSTFEPSGDDQRLIRELCRYLEGVPLAIELAASWVRVLSCPEILAEVKTNLDFLSRDLHDVPERHRSLEAAFDSSWRLLSDDERRFFRRLSIFVGGFDKRSAMAVTDVDVDGLSALLDQSLVRRSGSDRFEMLDVLRQFAREKLTADPHEADWISRRHAAYYLELANGGRGGDDVSESNRAAAAVASEIDNVRAAWEWGVAHLMYGELDGAVDGLFEHYHRCGRSLEGEEVFSAAERALATRNGDEKSIRPLARIRIRQGVFNSYLARYGRAEQLLASGRSAMLGSGANRDVALATEYLGWIALYRGEYDNAEAAYRESFALYEKLSSPRGMGRALVGLGNLAYTSGNFSEAKDLYERSTTLQRQADDRPGLASSLCNLGIIAATDGDYPLANQLLNESLEIAQSTENQRGIANALQNLGATAFRAGELETAEEHTRRGIELCREMGYRRALPALLNILGAIYEQSGKPEEAIGAFREALSAAVEISETPAIVESLFCCTRIIGKADPERGLETLSFILSHPAADESTRSDARKLLLEWGQSAPGAQQHQPDFESEAGSLDRLVDEVLKGPHGPPREARPKPTLTPEQTP